jgi:hypothetical protein
VTGASDSIFADLTDLQDITEVSQIESTVLHRSAQSSQEIETPAASGPVVADSDNTAAVDSAPAADVGEPEGHGAGLANDAPSGTDPGECDKNRSNIVGGDTERDLPIVAHRLASADLIAKSLSEDPVAEQANLQQPRHHEMNPVERFADPLSFVVQSAPISLPIELDSDSPPRAADVAEANPSPQPSDASKLGSMEPTLAAAAPLKPRTVDPEALTSHITTRLTEMRQSRTIVQQVLRWTAITVGIIVPSTVVAWVVHRIYSDWQ